MKKLCALLVLSFLATIASAAAPFVWYPEDGTWRNPSAPGRNFKIDVQNDVLILNVFGYKVNGSAVWYQAANGWTESSGIKTFSATLNEYEDGQCVGCPYTKPVLVGPNGGDISIKFTGPSQASVNWEGDSFNIERSDVVVGKPPNLMLGTWTFVYQVGEASFSDIIELHTIFPPSTIAGATGIAGGTTNRGYLAGWECYKNAPSNPYNNACLLIFVDPVTDLVKDVYVLVPSINRAVGLWLGIGGTGSGYPAWGSRIAGYSDTLYKILSVKSGVEHQTSGGQDLATSEADFLGSPTMGTGKYDEAVDLIKEALLYMNEARD